MKIPTKISNVIFDALNTTFMLLLIAVTGYPFLYIASLSLSDTSAILMGKVTLFPVGLNFDAYKMVFQNEAIWRSYGNTILYTLVGTGFQLIGTTLVAYPLSKSRLMFRMPITFFLTFTMFFGGGLIPSYLLLKNFHWIDTMWAITVPGAVTVYNSIILRTFFQQLPKELEEAATVDGMGNFGILTRIYMPLSLPIYATLTLFFTVGHWNSYFGPSIYLNSKSKYTLQLILREIIALSSGVESTVQQQEGPVVVAQSVRSATIIVVMLPILMAYPFLQKYFIKGMLVGSIKG